MNHPTDKRAAAIADFRESGDTIAEVADRHGIARSTLGTWTAGMRGHLELTGGQWVNVRGVMRWQPAHHFDRNMKPAEIRARAEERMFTEAEARDAHAAFFAGCREPRTVLGERVYQRRQKREQRQRARAA